MPFTKEEIQNLENLLFSPVEENVKLAFAILEGKEYPEEIKLLVEEYQILYNCLYKNAKYSLGKVFEEINHMAHRKYNKVLEINPIAKNKGLFKNITYLDLHEAKLTQLPVFLSKLTKLKDLDLSESKLDETDLSALASLKKLKELNLSFTNLKQLPNILSKIPSLEILDLSYNDLSQADFTILSYLKNIGYLNLNHCDIQALPADIVALTNLKDLYIDGNNFTLQTDFSVLALLPNLKFLSFVDCGFDIEIHPTIAALKNKGVGIQIGY